jgi:RecA-family ATPase
VRFAVVFTTSLGPRSCAKQDGGEQPDGDLRELEFKKKQYGPTGETIVLRYQRGLFLPEHGMSIIEKAARETMVDDALITIGKKLVARGQELSPAQTSHHYAVSLIAKQPEARGIKKAELADALGRLLDQGSRLRIETLKPGTAKEKKVIRF